MTDKEPTTSNDPASDGAEVGKTTNGPAETVRFSDNLLKQNHLYVGNTGTGKSTALGHIIRHLMTEKAAGRSDRALIVIDPSSDLMLNVLGNTPEELIPNVKLVELGDPDRVPIINLLDTAMFRDRDQTADVIVNTSRSLFPGMGPRQQHTLSQAIKSLHEANRHPLIKREDQYTLLDVPRLLDDEDFRSQVLSRVADTALAHWWFTTFSDLTPREHQKVTMPVLNCFNTYTYSNHARVILGEPVCTPDIRATIESGDIILASTDSTYVGSAVATLIGAAILSLSNAIMHEQGLTGRAMSIIVDDMEAFPADYAALMVESGKAGSNMIVATNDLSGLVNGDKRAREIILSNLACLCVFQVTSADARELIYELGQEFLTEFNLTQQAPFRCYVSVRE